MLPKRHYLKARQKYHPNNHGSRLKLIVVAESSPVSCNYLYFDDGSQTEALYSALVQAFLTGYLPRDKADGLRALASKGLLLVDTTYEPVNGIKLRSMRRQKLEDAIPGLIDDLRSLDPKSKVEILVIKKPVCRIVGPRLINEGFRVINRPGKREDEIPFPNYIHRPKFLAILRRLRAQGRLRM